MNVIEKDGIRFFSDDALQASIDKALASVTSDSAVLQLEANALGINAAVAAKLGEQWSIVVGYKHDSWGHGVATKVRFEW